ncbi:DUF6284 family protein [Streptomyces sp. B1866]|uniref:DUF6284 family protein n=1 Tax=Streptomyces sp. B1866 TaxID=3075431 RepID=UPI00289077CC|nr:DUF6284 family protein [Streptomyces sp. B1866]MDT3396144.1 DUF6284 family protein [Streptomyces sp. B1866]
MSHTGPDPGTASGIDREPTDDELAAIDREMPVILAEVDLLDVRIAMFDRPLHPIDARRVRRAERRLMAARARLASARPQHRAGVLA